MRSTIVAHDTSTVNAENDMQLRQRHIVDDIVVGTLQKTGVDIAVGNQSRFRHTCGERDGMSFGYADIEYAIGQFALHDIHATATRHSRCNTYYTLVLFCQLQ